MSKSSTDLQLVAGYFQFLVIPPLAGESLFEGLIENLANHQLVLNVVPDDVAPLVWRVRLSRDCTEAKLREIISTLEALFPRWQIAYLTMSGNASSPQRFAKMVISGL